MILAFFGKFLRLKRRIQRALDISNLPNYDFGIFRQMFET